MARRSVRGFPTQHNRDVARVLHEEWAKLLLELDELRALHTGTGIVTPTVLSIGSTDDQIASTAFTFVADGVKVRRAAVAAGTAPPAETVPQDTWAIYRLSVQVGGTITVTPGAANATTGYATEAAAIAALPATPAGEVDMGYVTVLTGVGSAWVAATDAFAGGAAGNPASETNYYPAASLLSADSSESAAAEIRATR